MQFLVSGTLVFNLDTQHIFKLLRSAPRTAITRSKIEA